MAILSIKSSSEGLCRRSFITSSNSWKDKKEIYCKDTKDKVKLYVSFNIWLFDAFEGSEFLKYYVRRDIIKIQSTIQLGSRQRTIHILRKHIFRMFLVVKISKNWHFYNSIFSPFQKSLRAKGCQLTNIVIPLGFTFFFRIPNILYSKNTDATISSNYIPSLWWPLTTS